MGLYFTKYIPPDKTPITLELWGSFANVNALLDDDTYGTLIDQAQANGVKSQWVEDLDVTIYPFTALQAENITQAISYDLFINHDIRTVSPGGIWAEIPTADLDNDVPDTWDLATYEDSDGNTVNRTYREYSKCIVGDGDTSLYRLGHYKSTSSNTYDTDSDATVEQVQAYVAEFTDVTTLYFGSFKDDWVTENVTSTSAS